MPKISEPAIKDRDNQSWQMADPMILKVGGSRGLPSSSSQYLPVNSRRLSPRAQMAERGKPVKLLWQQRKVSRKTNYGFAGMGGSSKQMLVCNGPDTNVNRSARK